ncbi:oligosaccharide flippase family protein [Listeria booriae]|uniref:Oligosaccharide flippase family protein n=1 Tax=Listeria booriae TaxID=1552123 RepID=A0A842CTG6_9LIST|nr:oligosaccharide flippase family protein [Listeria booriae]MBC2005075.1 oligosaccharide flippase family protein [Listeria booriae]
MRRATGFKKHLVTLVSGNIVAQVITFTASPLLTRMYTPEQFGEYAAFISLVSILAVVLGLSFEKCIPLALNDKVAGQITVLCLELAGGITVILFSIYCLFGWSLVATFVGRTSVWIEISFCLSIFCASAAQSLNFWHIRVQRFTSTSRAKIGQSAVNVVTQIGLSGMRNWSSVGLQFGDTAGRFAAAWMQFWSFARHHRVRGVWRTKPWNRYIWQKFYRYPLYTSFSVLLNAVALQMPVLLLGKFFSTAVSGNFMLTQKMVGIPITIIATALAQVFYSEASRHIRREPNKVLFLYKKITRTLFLVGVVPFAIVAFFGPALFEWLFGAGWETSGEYLQILAVAFLAQLVVLPVSQVLYITDNQLVQIGWDACRFVSFFLVFWLASAHGLSAKSTLLLYAIVAMAYYAALYLLGMYFIKRKITCRKEAIWT